MNVKTYNIELLEEFCDLLSLGIKTIIRQKILYSNISSSFELYITSMIEKVWFSCMNLKIFIFEEGSNKG